MNKTNKTSKIFMIFISIIILLVSLYLNNYSLLGKFTLFMIIAILLFLYNLISLIISKKKKVQYDMESNLALNTKHHKNKQASQSYGLKSNKPITEPFNISSAKPTKLVDYRRCPYCGRIIKYDYIFCPYCGSKLK